MLVISCICGSLIALALIALLGRHLLASRNPNKPDGSVVRHDRAPTSFAYRPWSGSQLVLTTTEGETLVLDCLVPTSDPCPEEDRTVLVPMTLRAHLPHHHTSPSGSNVGATVGEWANTGAPVDISLGQDKGIAVLRISDERSLVTLELEKAHRAR